MASDSEAQDKKLESMESATISVRDVSESETVGWDRDATQRLLRKLDWSIIPIVSIIYLCVSRLE